MDKELWMEIMKLETNDHIIYNFTRGTSRGLGSPYH